MPDNTPEHNSGENINENKTREKGFWGKNGYYIALLVLAVSVGFFGYIARVEDNRRKQARESEQRQILQETITGGEDGRSVDDGIYPSAIKPAAGFSETAVDINESGESGSGVPVSSTARQITVSPQSRVNQTAIIPETDTNMEINNGETGVNEAEEENAPAMAALSSDKFIMPVFGEIIFPFSLENLIFSPTFEDWRTHDGVDIRAASGERVFAAGDGVVREIYTDDYYGITVVIDHGGGIFTLYKNLSTDNMVTLNQAVNTGTVISGVGDTAAAERNMEPHLHFGMIRGGEKTDPMKYVVMARDR